MIHGIIRCAACPAILTLNGLCSPLAEITLHWMHEHPARYADTHPGTRPYLVEAGLLSVGESLFAANTVDVE